MDKNLWIGFDLGGTKMLVLVFDDAFKVRARVRKKVKSDSDEGASPERIIKAIDSALEEAGASRGAIAGIGIGAPGALDLDSGVVVNAPNLGWKRVPLKEMLEKELDCPVVVVNDVDAGVYGEYRFGAARESRCVVGVFPGTGVGGGCVYEGRLLRGARNSCMEIGHMQMLPEGPLCGCGRRGCLEALAGRLAISAAAAAAAYRGEAPKLLGRAGTDLAEIRSGALAAAIDGGDRSVERIVRQAARWIGVAVGNVVNLLAPDTVVLGGGLVEAMPSLYSEEVEKGACARVMPGLEKTFRIAISKLGDDATATGAAAWCGSRTTNGKRPLPAKS